MGSRYEGTDEKENTMKDEKKITFTIPEEVIDELAEKAVERIMKTINECIQETVQYDLLPEHMAKTITDHITDKSHITLTKIEIDLLQIKGSLIKKVTQKVRSLLPTLLQEKLWENFE